MDDREFVKIENRIMPVDDFRNFDLFLNKKEQYGFTNLLFLFSGIITAFMWAIYYL